MFITTATERLKLKDSENEYLLEMYNDTTRFYLENRNIELTEEQYQKAVDCFCEITEMAFSLEHVKIILNLYPHAKIRFALDSNAEDLSFAISHFFLGCDWPTYGEKVNIDNFVSLLQEQITIIFPEVTKSTD